ncbi:MAG: DUF2497 domain-containing protein [Alphaproteobacteria bacterium]
MTEQPTEPSMEEILSSIRRILSTEDGTKNKTEEKLSEVIAQKENFEPKADDVMELTQDMLCEEEKKEPEQPSEHFDNSDMELLSEATLQASADRLNNLTERLISDKKPSCNTSVSEQTMEDFVASLLRPYLKEWLDAHLPDLVEKIVSKEVERLTKTTR